MDEQSNQGAVETPCRFCGCEETTQEARMRSDHYQVVVACIACGNDFAAISRN